MHQPVDGLQVLEFGQVSALRSQTLWHAVGSAMSPADAPTLSFVRPEAPYVCLGYHRRISELDLAYCADAQLPVYRRMVGGGPVYLDADQLFFQLAIPMRVVPPRRDLALAQLLEPAAEALRTLGVAARIDAAGELSVDDRKVCGHGAGQLGESLLVVGNLITAFDHERATRVLSSPSPATRAEVLRLMRRYVGTTAVNPADWRQAMVDAYAHHFDARARTRELNRAEHAELDRFDRKFIDPAWITGERHLNPTPARPAAVSTVKVRAGVWVHSWAEGGTCTVLSVAHGRVDNVIVESTADHADAGPAGRAAQQPAASWTYADLVGARLEVARRELDRQPLTKPLAAALAATNPGGIRATS